MVWVKGYFRLKISGNKRDKMICFCVFNDKLAVRTGLEPVMGI